MRRVDKRSASTIPPATMADALRLSNPTILEFLTANLAPFIVLSARVGWVERKRNPSFHPYRSPMGFAITQLAYSLLVRQYH